MEVKIYREIENVELMNDDKQLAEYHKLMNELGIESKQDSVVPSVYQILNTAQKYSMNALCPLVFEYKRYTRSTIPVEVLQCIKYAEDNNMFDKLEIWVDDVNVDPLLIGKKFASDSDRKNGYTWNMHHTLIARWGDCAVEFSKLIELGHEKIREKIKNQAINTQIRLDTFKTNPDFFLNEYLKTGAVKYDI